MKNNNILKAILSGVIVAIINFTLFIINIKYILDMTLESENIIAYVIFSLIVGLIAFALFLLKPKVAFIIFISGLLLGFILMINTNSKNMDGWEDLIGFLTFMILAIGGLIAGAIIQLVVYLVKKNKNKSAKENLNDTFTDINS